jgi:hypothetical protein
MAATPGKKVKQGIETYLQTSQNLQQAKDQPLTDPMANIAKGVTQQTVAAAEGASKKRDQVAEMTDPTKLGETVKVDPSAYQAPSQMSVTTGDPRQKGLAGFLGLDPESVTKQEGTTLGRIKDVVAGETTRIQDVAGGIREDKDKGLQGIEKALSEATGRVKDIEGRILGSNVSVGQVAPQSTLETNAILQQQGLAAQDPRSNVDALAALFGINYDPRLAGLASQIYGGEVAQVRGEAAQNVDQLAAAKAGRDSAMERYLGTVKEGQENVGKAREQLGKNIDEFIKGSEEKLKKFEEKKTEEAKASSQAEIKRIGDEGVQLATGLNKAFYDAVKKGDGAAQQKAIADLEAIVATMQKFGLSDPKVINTLKGIKNDYTKRTSLKPTGPGPDAATIPVTAGAQKINPIAVEDGMFWTN